MRLVPQKQDGNGGSPAEIREWVPHSCHCHALSNPNALDPGSEAGIYAIRMGTCNPTAVNV